MKLDDGKIRYIISAREKARAAVTSLSTSLYPREGWSSSTPSLVNAIYLRKMIEIGEFSKSLWHVDWHETKDPRWKGQWIVGYEDDASRFIAGHGVYPTLTSRYSVDVLDRTIRRYWRPVSILSDHGSTFYAVEAREREKGLTEFEKYLLRNHIKQILGRVNHPQTNGKMGKWFDVFEKKLKFFSSIDACIEWYNTIKPHGTLDLKTPVKAYCEKMPQLDALMDPSLMEASF